MLNINQHMLYFYKYIGDADRGLLSFLISLRYFILSVIDVHLLAWSI